MALVALRLEIREKSLAELRCGAHEGDCTSRTSGTILAPARALFVNTIASGRRPGEPSLGRRASAVGGALRRGLRLLAPDLLADLLERAPDQPRHVHLRDPHLLSDLRLRQPLEEPQVEDHSLPL